MAERRQIGRNSLAVGLAAAGLSLALIAGCSTSDQTMAAPTPTGDHAGTRKVANGPAKPAGVRSEESPATKHLKGDTESLLRPPPPPPQPPSPAPTAPDPKANAEPTPDATMDRVLAERPSGPVDQPSGQPAQNRLSVVPGEAPKSGQAGADLALFVSLASTAPPPALVSNYSVPFIQSASIQQVVAGGEKADTLLKQQSREQSTREIKSGDADGMGSGAPAGAAGAARPGVGGGGGGPGNRGPSGGPAGGGPGGGGAGGEGSAGGGKGAPPPGDATRPPARPAEPPRAPAGRSAGRPGDGVTAEQRRDRVAVPLRVGSDGDAKEEARRAGVDPELASDPRPRFDEELWVIQRPAPQARGAAAPEAPGSGALVLREAPRGSEQAAVLREMAVKASVTGPLSRVTVAQRFENPRDTAVDAAYILPLPRDAAITDFVMTVGDRRIRGVIRERAEAERIFLDAQRQGKVVALLGEESPNLFLQSIGNLEARAVMDVSITYFSTLEYREGAFEFVLPLAASPRYQGAASISPQVRDGHGVSVEVAVDAGVPIRGLDCPTHAVKIDRASPSEATVTLVPAEALPNRDLVLRIAVAGPDGACAALLPQTDQSGTYFSMLIVPPAAGAPAGRAAVELIIVADPASARTSDERAALRETVARLLGRLTPRDRFLVIDRGGEPAVPAAATPEAIAAALARLATPPGPAPLADLLREALAVPAPSGDRVVCLLARGEPAGTVDLLREARLHLGPARLFTMSLWDPAGLTLESLARIGRGGVVNLAGGAGQAAVDAFIDGLSRPVLTGLTIDWGGAEVADVFPRRLPDLCAGRPVHVVGRLVRPPEEGRGIRVVGTARGTEGSDRAALDVPWRRPAMTPGAVHTLWARAKVLSMSEALGRNPAADEALRREIVATALAHNLVSPFTSFISVDAMSNVQRQANRDPAPR